MRKGAGSTAKYSNDRGVSILIIAASMVFILGMAGLGIDLASLYVARNQAQRAADAAALAGARWWAKFACTSPTSSDISLLCQTNAKLQAQAVGEQNTIGGVKPDIDVNTDISFPSLNATDPQIRVVVARDAAHGNAMPTFFIRIFGITTANVSASATAEAYNGTSGASPVGSKCVKPWLLPDCDPNTTAISPNTYCRDSSNNINGGNYSADPAIVGQLITIKPGSPSSASGPSEFFPVYVQGDTTDTSTCPSCASTQTSSGSQSGDYYRSAIECCVQNPVVCGTNTVSSVNGNMVGPTDQGVQCLIQQGNGNSGGQDTYDPLTGIITAGSNNRYNLTGQISDSDSIITIPIYNGQVLCPGGSSGGNGLCQTSTQIQVTGFMKVFIQQVSAPQATVYAYVMSITTCSTGGSSGGGGSTPPPIIASAGTPVPVRLIQQ